VLVLPRKRTLIKSLLSHVVPALRTTHSYGNALGTASADGSYTVFLRQLITLHGCTGLRVPRVIAELGPGSSLGTGFAALIAGAEKYYALDLVNHTKPEHNLALFDQVAELFRRRAPVPASGRHSLRFPDLERYDFPEFLELGPARLFEERVAAIREDIASGTDNRLEMFAPWADRATIRPQSIDWVFSESVMEHIDDLAGAYAALGSWLKPSGHASHLIDFGSHGVTRDWNGHWALGDRVWTTLRGRRPYLINRQPYAEHLRLAQENGFVTVLERRSKRFDGLIPEEFAERFRSVDDEDARSHMVLLISRATERLDRLSRA
jgi:hypothetical protein